MGKLAVFRLHDAKPAEVEAAEWGLLDILVFLQVVDQLGDAILSVQFEDGVLGGKIFPFLANLHLNIKEFAGI